MSKVYLSLLTACMYAAMVSAQVNSLTLYKDDFPVHSSGGLYALLAKSTIKQSQIEVSSNAVIDGKAEDIKLEKIFVCDAPTGVTVGSILSTSASVSFSSAGTSFIVEYGAPGFTPGTGASPGTNGTIQTGGASPIGLTGLTDGTAYEVYVRNDCGVDGFSTNAGPVSFTTVCAATNIPYMEKFDAVTVPAVPLCINVENPGANFEVWRTVTTPDLARSYPNHIRIDFEVDGTTAMDDWFFTKGLNLTGGTSYRLRFNYRNSDGTAYIEKLEVKYGPSANAAGMTSGTLFTNTNINFNSWTEAGVNFTPSSSGVYYIGFHGFSDADQAFLSIDNVNVIVTPGCQPVTDVTISTIAGASAVVSFTSSGSNFVVEYGPPGFTPGTGAAAGGGTVSTTTTLSEEITGLATSQFYDVYVRQDCGAGNFSPNSLPVSFQAGLINDDAPGAILIAVGTGCTGAPFTTTGATASTGETANNAFPSCSGTIQAPVWFKFVAPSSGAVRISTDAGSGNTLSDSKLALFQAGDPDLYSTFEIVSCDEDGGSTSASMSVLYAAGLSAGTTYYVAVDKFDGGGSGGSFCITIDELNSSMIATSNSCGNSYQSPVGTNAGYNGWQPLLDGSSRLIALVKNPAGGAVDQYTVSQNINAAAVRNDGTSLQRYYLDRNFRIANTSATNVIVQFFFLNSELTTLQGVDNSVTASNLGVTRQTEATTGCHADFSSGNGASSFLPQTANGISTDGLLRWIEVATPGFSNFYLNGSKASLTLKTFLQGAYSAADLRHKNVTTAWANILNANALNQPYAGAPFNYPGTESVSSGFFVSTAATTNVLDWVLLELRNGTTPTIVVARRAAFIREDGAIVDLDGVSGPSFRNVPDGNYHLTIRHRNHLGIRTSVVQLVSGALGGNTPVHDFTTSQSQAFDNPVIATNDAMAQNGSVFIMWAGNANLDDFVRVTTQAIPAISSDASFILGSILGGNPNLTGSGYSVGDINMDGSVRATTLAIPSIPSDISFILGTTLSGNNNATRREHK